MEIDDKVYVWDEIELRIVEGKIKNIDNKNQIIYNIRYEDGRFLNISEELIADNKKEIIKKAEDSILKHIAMHKLNITNLAYRYNMLKSTGR